MKKILPSLILLAVILGCEEKATDLGAGQEWAHLVGTVKYSEDLSPVNQAFVRTMSHLETTLSDSNGAYDLAIAIPKDQQESVTLEIYKEGYVTISLPAIIRGGDITPMPVVTLERYLDSTVWDSTIGPEDPVSIVLLSLEPDTLSVSGASGLTSCQILCEVRDLQGNPVDSQHTAQIEFDLAVDPGGGAYLYPPSLVTNQNGQVTTTFYAGTMGGIAIIRAQFAGGSGATILPNIVIYQTGVPASINLISLQYDSVAVSGTGANEATTMVFEVRDAGGSPISSLQPETVAFSIQGATGGGEYLYPVLATTDALGQASTTLNSGTVSGALQILAILQSDTSIGCTPVPVVIHSGLPDQEHFAVVPRYINFPGFNFYGVTDSMTALVGDQYANPVPQGTAVYFTTDAGIIQGSATTGPDGFASVILFSGPPSPPASFPFGTITAQTVGDGGQVLTDNTLVLFSGVTQIYDVNPTGFDIANGGSQTFTLRVSDQNGYPLAHGSEIKVEPTAGAVLGDANVIFPDTQSQSWTYFSFVLFDNDTEETDPAVLAAISINITSPNGNASLLISGSMD